MMKNSLIKEKKAPKWTTYFSYSPKRQRVIFKIIFYSQNPQRTCYASLKRIAQETKTHINTVYDAVKIACSIGILRKKESIEIYSYHPLTGKPLFNKNVKLTYLGDSHLTAGEKCFGLINRAVSGGKTRGYIKKKELSQERGKKEERQEKFFPQNQRIQKDKSQKEEIFSKENNFFPLELKKRENSIITREDRSNFIIGLRKELEIKENNKVLEFSYFNPSLETILREVVHSKTKDILYQLEERRKSSSKVDL